MKQLLFILLMGWLLPCFSTHTIGGYIHYQQVNQYTYQIEVSLFQDVSSPAFQRREIVIDYGDGIQDSIQRQNVIPPNAGSSIGKSSFVTFHTYSQIGNYTVSVNDPNRTAGIDNMANSANVPLYVETTLSVKLDSNFRNQSPTLLASTNSSAAVAKELQINLTAIDADGDFLKYRLTNTKGIAGNAVPAYFIPNGAQLDTLSGQFSWTPSAAGIYAFTAEVLEYRDDMLISRTAVDFLIKVVAGINSTAQMRLISPHLSLDSCGTKSLRGKAGDTLNLSFTFSKVNVSPPPFTLDFLQDGGPPAAQLSTTLFSNNNDSMSIEVQYILDGSDARCAPYPIYARGTMLNDFFHDEQLFIYVQDSSLKACDSICYIESVNLAEHKKPREIELTVHPNPMQHQTVFSISSQAEADHYFLELFDPSAKLVFSKAFGSQKQLIIDRNGLKRGIYFYRIYKQENSLLKSGKLVIQ